MASNRILAIDVGANSVKLAEFQGTRGGGLALLRYGYGELGAAPGEEADTTALVQATLAELCASAKIKPGPALLTISGQSVFSRFVTLPPVDPKKIAQIVQYEAAQNVPFPINEVVWDYQLIGRGESSVDVLLVAVKAEDVERLAGAIERARFGTSLIDVAPLALYNAVRYNVGDVTAPTILLDIGARTTNLIFMEGTRFFNRSILIGGHTITQQVARELETSFDEAEDLKRRVGFVALGGAYEEPESEEAAAISKIARNVMTRLHVDVNRSINFYRSQQGGSAPRRVLLTGGGSVMPYTAEFFHEKLEVSVEYLNPFRNVRLADDVDREDLSRKAHLFGETVGLALRQVAECPVEINLLPPRIVSRKEVRRKVPYLAGAAMAVFLTLLCWFAYCHKATQEYSESLAGVTDKLRGLERYDRDLSRLKSDIGAIEEQVRQYIDLGTRRTQWNAVLNELSSCLGKLRAGKRAIWITRLMPTNPTDPAQAGGTGMMTPGYGGGMMMPGAAFMPYGAGMEGGTGAGFASPYGYGGGYAGMYGYGAEGLDDSSSTETVGPWQPGKPIPGLRFEGLGMADPKDPSANLMVNDFITCLKDSVLFDTNRTEWISLPLPGPGDIFFRFVAQAKFKRPLNSSGGDSE